MPPMADHSPILMAQGSSDALLEQLRARLAPAQWPLPLARLPQGTVLVGGAVRDGLLDRLPDEPDLDLVVPTDAIALSKALAQELHGTCVVLDEERSIARLVLGGWTVDIARQDGDRIEDDLWRRDYRLNAIAVSLQPWGQLWDPTGGVNDLRQGRLTAVSEANLTDDPLRLLRGVRLAAEIPLTICSQTMGWIERHAARLPEAAPERILSELQRLVRGNHADTAIAILRRGPLLRPWAAGGKPPAPADIEGLSSEEAAAAVPLARLTALVSDEGLIQLRASRGLRQRCKRLRVWQQRLGQAPESLAESDRLQLHEELDEDLPALALQLTKPVREIWLERWRNAEDPLFHPRAPIDGNSLVQALELQPGPRLGRLLHHLKLEHAFERIQTKAEAVGEAQRFLTRESDAL
ncbi:tRNA nucleotidyltransferase [Synechococcus sp. KORDI-52]|uniref:CCA tRNA nucleotidyltransferase n=1 Tax=Synechococcus sp. KORDI-52 TaxID=585425 RepID=UPI0004E0781B|nr:CCA tRNA nucleotidyltransferase [Synechococcus sp. KORDI-52]AII48345.1 tRNA nucleotidyltransferase [Synechococcus sp. KORDI-52]